MMHPTPTTERREMSTQKPEIDSRGKTPEDRADALAVRFVQQHITENGSLVGNDMLLTDLGVTGKIHHGMEGSEDEPPLVYLDFSDLGTTLFLPPRHDVTDTWRVIATLIALRDISVEWEEPYILAYDPLHPHGSLLISVDGKNPRLLDAALQDHMEIMISVIAEYLGNYILVRGQKGEKVFS